MFALALLLSSAVHASPLSDSMREAADTDKSRAIDVHLEREIDAPAERVWEILGARFADVAEWASLVDSSRVMQSSEVPSTWFVAPTAPVPGRWTPSGFGEPGEVLVMYSDADQALTFRAMNLPGMLLYSQNTQQVVSTGEGTSTVSFDIHAQPKFRVMRSKVSEIFERGLSQVLDDLAVYAETGEPSPAKLAANQAAE
jgi:hypothetical protein